jgi:peptide/nickel transport system permease protein
MKTYVVKRLLLMLPTFFGISLVVFVVLNFAPGRPQLAQQSADPTAAADGEQSQETYRIFKEQFSLDKPVLLNLRFALSEQEVEAALRRAAGLEPASLGARLQAQYELEDWGGYAVPHLVRIMDRTDAAGEPRLRDLAVHYLRLGARQPLISPFDPDLSPEVRAENRRREAENAQVRELRYAAAAPEADKQRVTAAWREWHAARAERWHYTLADKLRIALFDTRFAKYWSNLLRLDFGVSMVSREPVIATLLSKLKYSLTLSVGSLVLAYLISIPLGIYSAVRKGTAIDSTLTVALFMLYSLPSFFVATLLLYYFSEGADHPALRIFPTGGWAAPDAMQRTSLGQLGDIAWHLVLPMICLTYGSLAVLSRYMRTGLLDVIAADYVRTARAKGLPESTVIFKHAVRNGLLPILTLLAGLLPAVLGGSVIIEYIFGIPGMGLWTVESIFQRDYNVIMAVQLLTTILVLVGILLTDLGYALVDPRIRYQ